VQDAHVKLNQGLPWQKQHSTGRRPFSPENWTYNLKKKMVKCYIWNIAFCGAEIWTLRKVD
jgi:hypothetical protein